MACVSLNFGRGGDDNDNVMAVESRSDRKKRVSKIINVLSKVYPDARVELNYSNPLELLIATILSAQCTDKRVNMVTAELFKKYRTAADYANADLSELEKEIKVHWVLSQQGQKRFRQCARFWRRNTVGRCRQVWNCLRRYRAWVRKTANVLLGNAFGINAGIVVDTHVSRLANRLRLTEEEDPEKIERDLMELVPRELWTKFSNLLIWHGRRRCIARKPDCANCEIRNLVPLRR